MPARLRPGPAPGAAGRITVPVARTYALTEVPTAFDHFTTGTLGKIAITVA